MQHGRTDKNIDKPYSG